MLRNAFSYVVCPIVNSGNSKASFRKLQSTSFGLTASQSACLSQFPACVISVPFPAGLEWDERHSSLQFLQKREIPWEKVPFVPRPSLVPDPVTAFGKRRPEQSIKQERKSILSPEERAKIKPKAYLEPIKPYVSAREQTKERVFTGILRSTNQPNADSMDYVLPRLHRVAECPDLPYKRRMVSASDLPPVW